MVMQERQWITARKIATAHQKDRFVMAKYRKR